MDWTGNSRRSQSSTSNDDDATISPGTSPRTSYSTTARAPLLPPSRERSHTSHFQYPFNRNFSLLSRRRTTSSNPQAGPTNNDIGPLGLTTVYRPGDDDYLTADSNADPLAHIVFVHGLGGGSRKTWAKEGVFWPEHLLPKEDIFESTAIHSFGYDSDFKKSSTLNIDDFSRSLLTSMMNNPSIRDSSSPIILVGHSMGGLVMKKAYLLSKQRHVHLEMADRIKAIFFIATPHTGSSLAPTLEKIFQLSSGLKPYLKDLSRNSDLVQTINADFPPNSFDLMLFSFYETSALKLGGVRDVMIVPKPDATLNYAIEQSAPLYGDHRSICKFDSADDVNFKIIWQAIAACVKKVQLPPARRLSAASSRKSSGSNELGDYLGVWEPPADDLHRVRTDRLPGTCAYVSENAEYRKWLHGAVGSPRILWLRGPPGSGKSYAAGYAIEELDKIPGRCCYYFFVLDHKVKSSMEGFLLSMTWQMGNLYPDVRKRIVQICAKDRGIAKSTDHRTFQRKFWDQAIFRATLDHETHWVLDAFDECRQGQELARFLLRVQEKTHGKIKILITTRNPHSDYQLSLSNVVARDIRTEDIQRDIARYLQEKDHEVPGANAAERNSLQTLILEKANGCFLWVILVLKRLHKYDSAQDRLQILEGLPPGMDQLYSRIVQGMRFEENQMSKAILTWVTCAFRPLTTAELRYVLAKYVMKADEIDDIENIVSKHCYEMVYIDKNSNVKIRHASARQFLLRKDINSEFDSNVTIEEEEGNKVLALACLQYLNGDEMKAKPRRRMVAATAERSVFVSYACKAVSEHINKSSALDLDILHELSNFLKTNVLSWIEHLASGGELETVLQFAQVMKLFLQRKSRTDLLLGDEVVTIDAWVTDLVKLVTKFGHTILMHPESILQLIPAFCPHETAPFTQFARGPGNSVSVHGLSATNWDDCMGTVVVSRPESRDSGTTPNERLHSLATSNKSFCIGTSLGRIAVFNEKTCLEDKTLNHGQAVTLLQFGISQPVLASVSRHEIRIWNTETWEQEWNVPIKANCLDIAFVDDDRLLLAALKNNSFVVINRVNRSTKTTTWTETINDPYHRGWYHGHSPEFATINTQLGLVAAAYRSRPILVYNYDDEDSDYQLFDHKEGLIEGHDIHFGVTPTALAFSALPDTSLLAVSYNNSELVLFDTEEADVKVTVPGIYCSRLSSSPDGKTLAAARMDGSVEFYDFETFHKLYRIRSEGAVSALAFSADNYRFLVIRAGGRNCRIWEPATLYRRDMGYHSLRSPSVGSGSQDGVYIEPEDPIFLIGAIACDSTGDYCFVGKDDGTVSVYDAKNGLKTADLFSHVASIKGLYFGATADMQLLASVDTAGFLKAHELTRRLDSPCLARELFVHRASFTGVQQFLCKEDLTRVLLCSNDEATLLSLPTGVPVVTAVSCRNDDEEPYIWTQHPTDTSCLMYMTASSARIYSWSTLQQVAAVSNKPQVLSMGLPQLQEFEIQKVAPLFSGPNSILAATFQPQGRRGSHQAGTVVCFEPHTFASLASTEPSIPDNLLPKVHPLGDFISSIIGTFRERLIFLHEDGWICSIKAASLRGEDSEGVKHHFPPPADWLRTAREMLIRVSKKGDVWFVVKGEVVVVKRGLNKSVDVEVGRIR